MRLTKLFSKAPDNEMNKWFAQDGAELLRGLGICSGDHVLDFGCGIGSYVVPLLQVTGDTGLVVAIDKDNGKLRASAEQAIKWGAPGHLRKILTDGEADLAAIEDASLDAALVFDVLQHVEDWPQLFANIVRAVREGGRLLMNPSTLSHPGKVDADELLEVLHRFGIQLLQRRTCRLMHFKHFTEDEIWVCDIGLSDSAES